MPTGSKKGEDGFEGEDGFKYTAPVGSYSRGESPYGLMDMVGNVWEWCNDGPDGTSRIMRGGSYYFDIGGLHDDNSSSAPHSYFKSDLGFRLCMEN